MKWHGDAGVYENSHPINIGLSLHELFGSLPEFICSTVFLLVFRFVLFLAQLTELFSQGHRGQNVKIKFRVNHGGTNRNLFRDLKSCMRRPIVMNPDRTPETRSVWPTLRVKIARQKVDVNRHFQDHRMLASFWRGTLGLD